MAAPRDDHTTHEGHAERATSRDGDDRPADVDEQPASGGPVEPGGEQKHESVDSPPASDGPAQPGTS